MLCDRVKGKNGKENVGAEGRKENKGHGVCDSGEEKAGHLKNEEGKARMSTMLPNSYFLFPPVREGHRQPGLRHSGSSWRPGNGGAAFCPEPRAQTYIRGGAGGKAKAFH